MHPTLHQTRTALAEQLRDLDLAATQAHPRGEPASWNAQQIVEHLLATYDICTASLDARLVKGRALETPVPWKARLAQWLTIDIGYFPRGRKAPEAVRPDDISATPQDGAGLNESVRIALTKLDEALDRVAVVYPSQPVSTHIVLGPLTVRQWRKFHRVHGRHHAKQLARVKGSSAS